MEKVSSLIRVGALLGALFILVFIKSDLSTGDLLGFLGISLRSQNVLLESGLEDMSNLDESEVTPEIKVTRGVIPGVTEVTRGVIKVTQTVSPYVFVSPTMSPSLLKPVFTNVIKQSSATPLSTVLVSVSPQVSPQVSPVTPSVSPTPKPSQTLTPIQSPTPAPLNPVPVELSVVINEIAWMGTKASQYAEWVELYNNTDSNIDLSNWGLFESGGEKLIISLTGEIDAGGYYIVERTTPSSQDPIIDINGDISGSFSGGGLRNKGEYLVIKDDESNIIDSVDASDEWFSAGDNSTKSSMERINPSKNGSISNNWGTNNGLYYTGLDAGGNRINGTPGMKNSIFYQ